MPNWTDDEGTNWFQRCMECGHMQNDDFKCINSKCVESYEPSPEEEEAQFQEDCAAILDFFGRY